MSKCLITGCALYIPAEGKHVHGDLHTVAPGVLVFNAVVNKEGEAYWEWHSGNADLMAVNANIVAAVGDYYEKRGVIAFSSDSAEFNQAARTYLGKHL